MKKNIFRGMLFLVLGFFCTMSAFAAVDIDYVRLGRFLGASGITSHHGPCPKGGAFMDSRFIEYYEHGYVEVMQSIDCDGISTTTKIPTYESALKILLEVSGGDVIAEMSTGSIDVYNATDVRNMSLIGNFESNGGKATAYGLPRNVPLVIVFKDENGRITASRKLLISE